MRLKALVAAAVLALSSCVAAPVLAADTTSPTFYVGGAASTVFQGNADRDNQTGLGVQAGVDFGSIRTELGYDRLFMSNNGSGTAGQVNAHQFTVRGFAEHDIGKFTPYVGAGLGVAVFDGSGVLNERARPVYQGLAGVNYNFNTDWTAGLGYEYTYSPARVRENGPSYESFDSHAVKVSVRYNF